ncbi:MAG: hypothetical protein DRZ90_11720 [Spirochaetes bacterium]|nr:MAG: hypothetical protein DRP49_01560 [Spirochaetota bacterium]RKX94569.1 MAG: hypothetical protein DRZ90_11720 [Spirochaetota bacterium]
MIEAIAASAVPLILAATGGLLSEQAGVLNISLEGCITSGAFTAALVLNAGGSIPLALAASLVSGILIGVLLSAAHIRMGANLFIAGLGINLLVPSLAGLVSAKVLGHKGTIRIPAAILHGFNGIALPIITWLMIPLAGAAALIIYRSSFGRRIRSAGSSPAFLEERGISSAGVRTWALIISSGMAALSGAFLVFRIEAFVPGMSSGRGWIALVIIWLGFRRYSGILIAAYFFSMIEIISGRAQGISNIPSTLLLALPYTAALFALTLTAVGRKMKMNTVFRT